MSKDTKSSVKMLSPMVIVPAFAASALVLLAGSPFLSIHIDKVVDKKMEEKLPLMIQAATAKVEDEKAALVIAANLKGWEAAEEGMPEGRNIYGSLDAEFTLVEYSDLECTFCKRFHNTPKDLVDQAGGRINWEWQHLPLGFHNPVSSNASHAALCVSETAGNKAFWAFTDVWFNASGMGGRGYPNPAELAASVGAPSDKFDACMDSGRYKPLIKSQGEKATELGVNGTPGTYVVDNTTGNRVFVRGAQPASALIGAIQQLQGMRESGSKGDES